MPEEIVMPRLSDTMEEGTISQWLKREGDSVKRGDAILEVQTDKANMELEAYSDGVIQQILFEDGSTVPIGTVVGVLAKAGEEVAPAAPTRAQAAAGTGAQGTSPSGAAALDSAGEIGDAIAEDEGAEEIPVGVPAAVMPTTTGATGATGAATAPARTSNGATPGGRVKASPLARNIAREHNIDLAALDGRGSGPGGRIVKLDIERYLVAQGTAAAPAIPAAPQPQAAPAATTASAPLMEGDEERPANRVQQIMARRLLESKTTIPHFYVTAEADMAAAGDLRAQIRQIFGDEEGRVSYNDIIVRACALALRAMPDVNRSWREGQFVQHSHVNVGIAVNVADGLLVPVVKDADRKGLREIAAEARALAEKARAGKLAPRDMEGGTFSTSNLGAFDVEQFQAIINPPESAILAIGTILEKPVAVDGQIVIRPRMRMSLSVDHRVIPGVPAAQFLQLVKQLLQEPLRLGF